MTDAMTGALAAQVDADRERAIAFLADLVRIPTDNPPGDLAPAAERVAGLLEELGLVVERHPVGDADLAQAGMVSATNLVVRRRFGGGAGPVIALNAHGDVVPPGAGWSVDPYGAVIRDGWMIGRGVAVSKSDIATYAFAMRALDAIGDHLDGTIELHVTWDEETGGAIGPALLLANGISRPDLALCAGFSYAVTVAHAGCLHLEISLRGRSAHAARPSSGIDALEAASHVLAALYAERHRLAAIGSAVEGIGGPQLTVGRIEGGINTNVVPDRVTLRLDRRITPEESPDEVEAALAALVVQAGVAVEGARVETRRILLARPLPPQTLAAGSAAALLSRAIRAAAAGILGETVGETGVPLYTDARHYAEAGVPVILYGAGPRSIEEANAHRADERLPVAILARATLIVARGLATMLGAPA